MLALWENSSMIIDTFSLEVEEMFSISSKVAMDCSSGFVTVISTSSGEAPG